MEKPVLKVGEFIAVINQTLEYAYSSVIVEGEVSSFKVNQGKYVFFDLKDEEGVVGCFMMLFALKMPLSDGMRIRVEAVPKLTPWGKFSLTVRNISLVGEGDIKKSFELLRAKLDKEGLFDITRKRSLPKLPTSIGVISSTDSAGYKDFIKIINNRWRGLDVQVAHVQVQGFSADDQIISALDYFNEHLQVEAIVLVRGGGSAEDLAVFNNEPLVRAIAGSRLPVLVGVGHEVDVSLADMAADVRAATPSNAAEILVPDRREVLSHIDHTRKRIALILSEQIKYLKKQVNDFPLFATRQLNARVKENSERLNYLIGTLKQLDPSVVLKRGYAIVRSANGKLLRGKDVRIGDKLQIQTGSLKIIAGVEDVQE